MIDEGTALFDEVVARTGLNPMIAPFTVSRLLLRADVQPKRLTRGDLARALPTLEEGLAVYLRGAELDAALASLRELAEAGDA